MELRITQPEAAILAQRVATAMGVSVEEAVMQALRDQVRHVDNQTVTKPPKLTAEQQKRLDNVKKIVEEVKRLPVYDTRSLEEMLYDENGLPK